MVLVATPGQLTQLIGRQMLPDAVAAQHKGLSRPQQRRAVIHLWRQLTAQTPQQLVLVRIMGHLPGSKLTTTHFQLRQAVILGLPEAMPPLKSIQAAVAHVRPRHAVAPHQQGHHGRMRLTAWQAAPTATQLDMGFLTQAFQKQWAGLVAPSTLLPQLTGNLDDTLGSQLARAVATHAISHHQQPRIQGWIMQADQMILLSRPTASRTSTNNPRQVASLDLLVHRHLAGGFQSAACPA